MQTAVTHIEPHEGIRSKVSPGEDEMTAMLDR